MMVLFTIAMILLTIAILVITICFTAALTIMPYISGSLISLVISTEVLFAKSIVPGPSFYELLHNPLCGRGHHRRIDAYQGNQQSNNLVFQ